MNGKTILNLLLCTLLCIPSSARSSAIESMLERIDEGASAKFKIEIRRSSSDKDWFELESRGGKVVVRADSDISAAVGVDVVRQAVADKGRSLYQHTMADWRCFYRQAFLKGRDAFREALLLQDRLLGSRPEFMVGSWIKQALDYPCF